MEKLKKIIFEDEAITGDVTNALDYKYMKSLRIHLKVINAWPGDDIGGSQSKKKIIINIFLITISFCCLTSSLHFMVTHWDTLTFFELGHMYVVYFVLTNTMTRLLFAMPYSTKFRHVGEMFLTKMHLIYYKDVSEYAMKTYKQINLISRLFTLILTGQMLGGLSLFNLIPMWSNYSKGKFKQRVLYNTTYEHSLDLSVPGLKLYTHFDAYVPICIYHWFQAYIASTTICMLDLLLSLMVFNLWGHLKILLHDLASFPLPAKEVISLMDDKNACVTAEMYSKEELKFVSYKLMQCIDYHRLISDFTDKMSDAFGPMLFASFMFYQVSGCLLLLECSQGTAEALIRYLPLSFIIFQQLIQVSIIFELIGSTSEKLKDAVYGVPWQYMDTNNRKIIAIFLYNVQEPIHVKALGVVNVGVTTMASILKTSLSYFTFLRSV